MDNSSTTNKPRTIGDLIFWAARDFKKRGIESARLDAELLLASALGLKRVDLYLRFEQCPEQSGLDRFRESVKRRRAREPVAHIIGKKEFQEIEVMVPAGAFVPRPETELLVDEAVARLRLAGTSGPRVLDVGTGTGAIILAIIHAVPGLEAWASDLDPKAGQVLMHNADRLGMADRVSFRCGDLFEPIADLAYFDLIACNPPYVPSAEIGGLMPEVREHEPRAALDGGPEGLDFIKRLLDQAPPRLRPGGWLIMEIGPGQEDKVRAMAPDNILHETTRKDLAGIPRIIIFKRID